jgi:tetratricopeptide (TPR) repeat protein
VIILLNIGVLVFVAGGAWWLTGIDKTAGGESKRSRYFSRALRCLVILFLAAGFLWFIEQPNLGLGGIPFLLILPVSIALVLRSSVSELFAHGFLQLLDPALHDDRELDLKRAQRYQDSIAHLIHHGKHAEAVRLCEELKKSGELDVATLETALEFLGVKPDRTALPQPLNKAAQLKAQGKFTEAEQALKSLLAKNPADPGAGLMLMRLYAQDLRQPDKAAEVLCELEKQPQVSTNHLEFARRSIVEWSQPRPKPVVEPALPESLDEMLAKGFFGSAIEMLEQKIKEQPHDFELRLKLAEVHARQCDNFPRAEKIVRQIAKAENFSAAEVASAEVRLKEWREARLQRK